MIPKKIHFCWLSDEPYPELISKCIASWQRYLPDYEFVLWDKNKFNIENIPWVKEAYANKKYAFAADYIRLYALYTEGGIYLDSDIEVIKDISPLLEQTSFMGFETAGCLEPAVMGAGQGMEWVKKCLDYYKDKHFIKSDGTLEMRPLPGIMGEILDKDYSLPKNISDSIVLNNAGLTLYPAHYFSPKNYHTKQIHITSETYTIHHFEVSWAQKGLVYKLKKYLHRIIISTLGQKMHDLIVNKFKNV
ncbi:glycosyltransferase family 32 protein [Paludibacter jiangxiensis]|uniref:Glycosyltransferase sugar-binding region containing DXD motif-containing protein n=1 Tax=Paludibacter jiangxiensis TaxID=681398 RepID=A0A161LDJ6_9BACT|nr:glycosyltransferase [Paludibacter jiangxiensis]GAT62305.1 glycosyltransferase sugar-binding region containing DXD motif-containing protein [Paludibacter jiangxiensis]